MKKSIIMLLAVLGVLLITPVFAGITPAKTVTLNENQSKAATSDETKSENKISENKSNILNDDEIDYILTKVLEYADENTNREAVKAIIALCKNNYIFNKSTNSSQDEVDIDTYSDEFLEELRILYNEITITFQYNNELVYIPITNISPGYIVTDDRYPYIISVACPWDVFSEDYIPNSEYSCGISVNSIIYLCENGSDYTDALSWLIPKLSN